MLLATAPFGPVHILPGQCLGWALPLPLNTSTPAIDQPWDISEPGSSDIFWVRAISKARPPLKIKIEGSDFVGLLDSGADTTHMSPYQWPPSWPAVSTTDSVSGVVEQARKVLQNTRGLTWEDKDGDKGTMKPYILPALPVNLWGQNVLEQMEVYIIKCKNKAAIQQMIFRA